MVLPCFSKILKHIFWNRLKPCLADNNILFNNEFGCRADHSTENVLSKLIDQISYGFNDKPYFLGVSSDLLKAIDTVHHEIL